MTIWWMVLAAAALVLVLYARKGQNAVWGTATLGALVGVGLAIYHPGFDWWTVGKAVSVATFIGLALDLLPLLASRNRSLAEDPHVHSDRVVENPGEEKPRRPVPFQLPTGLDALHVTGATPDISDAEPFDQRSIGQYLALAFRDISPFGKRGSGRAVVEYPFVLALARSSDRASVFFVTVEAGMMFDTYMLCSFDANGQHSNFGSWPKDADEQAFLTRALEIAEARVARASKLES